jgi:hypothetical protein
MLLVAPYQTIELSNISVLPYHTDKKERTVAPIHYIKNGLIMQGFTLLSPPLTVTSYDASLNRLQLNTTNNRGFANKLMAIQDYFSQTDSAFTFQRLCSPSSLILYLFPSTPVHHSSETSTIANVKPGDTVRCVIRLHNLFRIGQVLRLQHSVPIIYGING